MDRIHRKELKHDKFVEQVGHTVEYAAEHKQQFVRYGIGAAVALVLILGFWAWRNYQHGQRQAALREALQIQNAQVGAPDAQASQFFKIYPTEAEKQKAIEKTWKDMAEKYSGTDEGAIARFYLGVYYAERGNMAEAEKHLKAAVDTGDRNYASQAKLSLAQLYESTGRKPDAEKALRDLMANPTLMVTKEQATISLAQMIAPERPDEARKLLEPLRAVPGAPSRVAISTLSQLPNRQP